MRNLKLYYGTFSGGTLNGLIGYTVQFESQKISKQEMADLIWVLKEHNHPGRIVVLRATKNFPPKIIMLNFLLTLKSCCDVKVLAISKGEYPEWIFEGPKKLVDEMIVHLHEHLWSPFACLQLWYSPKKTDAPEPKIVQNPETGLPTLYTTAPMEWIEKAHGVWHKLLFVEEERETLYEG